MMFIIETVDHLSPFRVRIPYRPAHLRNALRFTVLVSLDGDTFYPLYSIKEQSQ